MIEKAKYENADGSYIFLHDANWPFSNYTTEVDVRSDDQDKAGEWGIHENYTYLGLRRHHIEGDLLAEDSPDYWYRRLDFIRAVTPKKSERLPGKLRLELSGIFEDLWCWCTIDGWPELPLEALSPSAGRFLISFKSFDPRLYGNHLNELTVSDITSTQGRVYPKTYTWQYSSIGTSDGVAFNAGNAPTLPTVVIYGPAMNPRIQLNSAAGAEAYVQVNTTLLTASDFVTIDFPNTTARDKYGVDIYNEVSAGSEWWELAPGSNEIVYLADDAVAPTKAVVQWYNAYMI